MVAIFGFALFCNYVLDFEFLILLICFSLLLLRRSFYNLLLVLECLFVFLVVKSIDMFFIRVECIVNYLGWAGLYYFYI